MQVIRGNIWDFHADGFPVVITTNCELNSKGEAIMGKGIALEAKRHFPGLPKMLGQHIKRFYSAVKYFPEFNLFIFPTKYNWREKSDLDLICESSIGLDHIVYQKFNVCNDSHFKKVYTVKPGCNNGQLNWEDVEEVLNRNLDKDRFIVVDN